MGNISSTSSSLPTGTRASVVLRRCWRSAGQGGGRTVSVSGGEVKGGGARSEFCQPLMRRIVILPERRSRAAPAVVVGPCLTSGPIPWGGHAVGRRGKAAVPEHRCAWSGRRPASTRGRSRSCFRRQLPVLRLADLVPIFRLLFFVIVRSVHHDGTTLLQPSPWSSNRVHFTKRFTHRGAHPASRRCRSWRPRPAGPPR